MEETSGGMERRVLSIRLENGKTEEDGVYGIGESFRPAGTVTFSDGPADIAALPAGSFSVTGYDSSRSGLCSVRVTAGEVSSDMLSIEIAGLAKRLNRAGTRKLVLWANEEVETVELSGAHITLASSGNGPEGRRSLELTKSGAMFALYNNASLTLDNITLRGHGGNNSPLVYVESSALVLDGSAISGNGGGGVHVKNGTFTMNGGEISGNSLNLKGEISRDSNVNRGGGVYVENGTFTMNGGKIFGNAVNADTEISGYFTNAGGVYVTDGTFTMNGGEIFNNAAYYVENPFQNRSGVHIGNGVITMNSGRIFNNSGSGVLLFGETSFTMNGGEISGNDGSGVSAYEGGLFTMEDGEISGHSDYHGVYVRDGTFTMEGGKISGNGGTYGGGVNAGLRSVFTMNGGEISGNFTEEEGGGVYAQSGSVFTMNGGTISGNSAGEKGGGVYIYTVYDSAFSKTGGTIYGYDPADSANPLWNKCVDQDGVIQNNSGHTVYIGSGSEKRRENSSGPEDALGAIYDSKTETWTYTGNWDG
ncbi:MAG: hypothetical protein LBK74_04255 [Treponema sp.]|nr:hypothetical protein [Treponema sp.]